MLPDSVPPLTRMLMISPVFPWPEFTGGFVRIAQLAKAFGTFYDVTLAIPVEGKESEYRARIPADLKARVLLAESTPKPWRRVSGMLSARPYHVEQCASRAMEKLVAWELQTTRYDLVYCHFQHSLQYVPRSISVPVVLDQHNVDIHYWQDKIDALHGLKKLASAWNLRKTRRYEFGLLPRISAYVSVCDEDRQLTRDYAAGIVKHFFVAPNGVDVDLYSPVDWSTREVSDVVTIGFLGRLDATFNAAAAEYLCGTLLPAVRSQAPRMTVRTMVVGANPSRRLRSLAEQDPLILLTGQVDDVAHRLHQMDILVAPLGHGAGTKLKALEAMSTALPVVGTPVTFRGLGGKDGTHYLQASDQDGLVRAILSLILQPHKMAEIGRAGRRFAEGQFDWRGISMRLKEELVAALVSQATPLRATACVGR